MVSGKGAWLRRQGAKLFYATSLVFLLFIFLRGALDEKPTVTESDRTQIQSLASTAIQAQFPDLILSEPAVGSPYWLVFSAPIWEVPPWDRPPDHTEKAIPFKLYLFDRATGDTNGQMFVAIFSNEPDELIEFWSTDDQDRGG